MFKVIYKDTRTMPMTNVSIVNLEHVITDWVTVRLKELFICSIIHSDFLNLFQLSVASHIETSNLIFTVN